MPYSRGYRRPVRRQNRRRRMSRPSPSPYGGYLDKAAKALAVAYSVKRLLNVEFKRTTLIATGGNLTEGGTITQLTNLSIGDTTTTRDGSQVKYTSVSFDGYFNQHASATQTMIRIVLVMDNQTNGAIFTTAQLFQDATADDVIVSPFNADFSNRFSILYDKKFAMTAGGKEIVTVKFWKKLSMTTKYSGTAGTIADLSEKSLALVFITDEATNVPTVHHQTRLRYLDN